MFYFVVCLFFLILCLKFRYVEYLLLVQLFSSHGGGGGAKDGVGTSERRERSERRAADPRSGYKSAHNQKLSTQAALHTQLTARLHVCGLTQMRLDNKKMSIRISGSDATWSRPPPACPEGRTGNYFVCWFTIMKMRTRRGRGWEKKERRREESSQCATPCCLLLLVRLIVTWS